MAYRDDSVTQQANLRYIRVAMDEPLLERNHELDLARRWRDKRDEKALHELIRAYGRLVVSIAAKFKHYGLPMGDLIQEGNIGLLEAASRFQPDLENRFSTYATWWVKAQIQEYVLRNWSIVRTGTTARQKSLFFNLRRLRSKLEGQSARPFLDNDAIHTIAKELDVSPKEVSEMESFMHGDRSLNAPLNKDTGEGEWQDMLTDHSPTPEDTLIRVKDGRLRTEWLKEALGTLDARELKIIQKRQLSDSALTLESLGKELGVSKERVRQLEVRAMEKLKTAVTSKADKLLLM